MPFSSLPQMFFERARELAKRPRCRVRRGDEWVETTWEATEARVYAVAAALVELGVAPVPGHAHREDPGPRGHGGPVGFAGRARRAF